MIWCKLQMQLQIDTSWPKFLSTFFQVLQLLPEYSIKQEEAETQVPQKLTEMQKIHKLVRIYCPFTYNHFKNVRKRKLLFTTIQCDHGVTTFSANLGLVWLNVSSDKIHLVRF